MKNLSIEKSNPSNKLFLLAQELEQLNEIYAPWKLTDNDLERWSIRLDAENAAITPEIVNAIVKKFILAELKYDKNLGIANIFVAYKKLYTRQMVY